MWDNHHNVSTKPYILKCTFYAKVYKPLISKCKLNHLHCLFKHSIQHAANCKVPIIYNLDIITCFR